MSIWQYAQLTIRLEGRGGEDSCTILWHGPGQGLGENFSGSGQTVLELMNRAGAEGWELADLEERREGGDGRTYWDAAWSLTTYTSSAWCPRSCAACRPGHRPGRPLMRSWSEILLVVSADDLAHGARLPSEPYSTGTAALPPCTSSVACGLASKTGLTCVTA